MVMLPRSNQRITLRKSSLRDGNYQSHDRSARENDRSTTSIHDLLPQIDTSAWRGVRALIAGQKFQERLARHGRGGRL